jgi:hypothetical protein
VTGVTRIRPDGHYPGIWKRDETGGRKSDGAMRATRAAHAALPSKTSTTIMTAYLKYFG